MSNDVLSCCCPDSQETFSENKRGGPTKDADEVTDVTSTGRKRAAEMYPIEKGVTTCEWSRLKRAGGGVKPITGCNDNLATHRHHGPDKNTLNNEVGNVHRICVHCHNRWHTNNDAYYGVRPTSGSDPFIPVGHEWHPHDPDTKATDEEIVQNEISWTRRKVKKADDESIGEPAA